MENNINKYYKDILPEDVIEEVNERLNELENEQEDVISNIKSTLPLNFDGLRVA